MTKAELFAAARGKPQPFELNGLSCHLLPVPWAELKALQAAHEPGNVETGERFTYEVIARSVCDEAGTPLLVPEDLPGPFPLSTLTALFQEVARRSGVNPETDRGKVSSPTES